MRHDTRSPAAVEAVTFDVGNTLITAWPSVGQIYAEVAAAHGCATATPELLEARFHAVWPTRLHLTESRAGWQQLVDEIFAGLAPIPPSQSFFAELYQRFARPEAWRIYEDVLPALDRLASMGLRLAVVSNWDERLRGLLRDLGLDARFETIVVSCEIGHAKPDRAIFEAVAQRLGLPAQRILHVGDSGESDYVGARAAGLQALQIRRAATQPEPHQLRSLLELPERLAETA